MNFNKKIYIEGKEYVAETRNKCDVCADRDPPHYMAVKFETAGGGYVLECPVCDNNITMPKGLVVLVKPLL